MSENELSVFDIKFNEAMERLDSLFSLGEEINSSFSIKSYIERYRLDKSLENRNSKNKENKKNQSDEKRKQIVDLYEIRNHEKKTKQYYNKNYLKNEIEWYKIKQREDEIKNKYNNNYNKQNIDDEFAKKELDKEIIRNNKLKMKKFANLANKVNIEKFKMQRKININNINKDAATLNSNENNDEGKFIPYSKFREFEFNKNKIKNKIGLNINKTNINTNKSEMINNKSRTKSQNKINNHLSQNIINNNNNQINLKKGNLRKNSEKNKALKPLNNNKYNIDIRKPLDEKIDYLRQMEKNRPEGKIKIYENKKLAKNKNNIELLNFHNKNLEDKAKRQEQLMRIKGNTYDRNEDNVKLSNLLIDSISTKLTILNQMASQKT
jgi:hypothetical protein